MPSAPDPTPQNGTAREEGRVKTADPAIIVRPYRDEDFHAVRQLLVESNMHGPGSPVGEGHKYLSRNVHRAYAAFAAGFAGLLMGSLDSTRYRMLAIGIQPWWLKWSLSAVCVVSILATGIFWYQRRTFDRLVKDWLNKALEREDMADIASAYKLRKMDDGRYELAGPTGFWVAVDGDKVVGEVGLKHTKDDETTGEVARLVVSPQYRKRGVGRILMNTVVAHGRASGLEALWLSTSGFHVAAVSMYKKTGWTLETTWTVMIKGMRWRGVSFRKQLG